VDAQTTSNGSSHPNSHYVFCEPRAMAAELSLQAPSSEGCQTRAAEAMLARRLALPYRMQ